MEHKVEIVVNGNPDHEDARFVKDNLRKFNLSKAPTKQNPISETINLILRTEDGTVIGGLLGAMGRFCYYLEILWVDDKYRGYGYGKKLLAEIEEIARAKGCKLMTVDTFSFQAPDFYKKNGFELFGVLDGFPEGICRYYFKKSL